MLCDRYLFLNAIKSAVFDFFAHVCCVRMRRRFRPKTREELQNELYQLEKKHRQALNRLKARRCDIFFFFAFYACTIRGCAA